MTVPCEKLLKEIEYVDYCPKDNRILFGTIYFSDLEKEFKVFVDPKDELTHLKCLGHSQGPYWSKTIVDTELDHFFKIINLIANNYSFNLPHDKEKDLMKYFNALTKDILNFGALIHKQFIIWEHIKNVGIDTHFSNIYTTELEYLMGLVRSFFDLIYKIIVSLYYIFNPKIPKKFPETLNKFYKRIDDKKYDISEPIKDFFNEILPLFRLCKNIRDSIYHWGMTPDVIFITEKGPGIGMQEIKGFIKDPFSDFKEFFEDDPNFADNLLKNDICSLFYLINRIIKFSLESTEKLADAIENTFDKPQSISNEYKIFFRAHQVQYINKIDEYLDQCWIEP